MHKVALEELTELGNNNLPQGETGIILLTLHYMIFCTL